MKMLTVILVGIVVLFGNEYANACSSEYTHPQVLFCQADYVIKILVDSKRQVFLQDDGTFVSENLSNEGDDSDRSTELSEVEPDPLVPPEPIVSIGEVIDEDADADENALESEDAESTLEISVSNEQPVEENHPELSTGGREIHWPGIRGPSNEQPIEENHPELSTGGREIEVNWPGIRGPSNEQPAEENHPEPSTGGREITWLRIRTRNHSNQKQSIARPLPNLASNTRLPARVSDGQEAPEDARQRHGGRRMAAAIRKVNVINLAARAPSTYSMVGPNGASPGRSKRFANAGENSRQLRPPFGAPGSSIALTKRDFPRYRRSRSHENNHGRRHHESRRRNPSGLRIPMGSPNRRLSTGTLMTQYSIRVLKVIKGNVSSTSQYLYTPPNGGLCRMRLSRKTPYIIMGNFRRHRRHTQLYVQQSDYKINVAQLSGDELRNLSNNMKHRYIKGCHRCNIKICPHCSKRPHECIWKNMYTLMDPRATQFACNPNKRNNGNCEWHHATNSSMTPANL